MLRQYQLYSKFWLLAGLAMKHLFHAASETASTRALSTQLRALQSLLTKRNADSRSTASEVTSSARAPSACVQAPTRGLVTRGWRPVACDTERFYVRTFIPIHSIV